MGWRELDGEEEGEEFLAFKVPGGSLLRQDLVTELKGSDATFGLTVGDVVLTSGESFRLERPETAGVLYRGSACERKR